MTLLIASVRADEDLEFKAAKGIVMLTFFNRWCAPVPSKTMFWATFIIADLPIAVIREAVQAVRFETMATPHDVVCAKFKPGVDRASAALSEQFDFFTLPPPTPKRKK